MCREFQQLPQSTLLETTELATVMLPVFPTTRPSYVEVQIAYGVGDRHQRCAHLALPLVQSNHYPNRFRPAVPPRQSPVISLPGCFLYRINSATTVDSTDVQFASVVERYGQRYVVYCDATDDDDVVSVSRGLHQSVVANLHFVLGFRYQTWWYGVA